MSRVDWWQIFYGITNVIEVFKNLHVTKILSSICIMMQMCPMLLVTEQIDPLLRQHSAIEDSVEYSNGKI